MLSSGSMLYVYVSSVSRLITFRMIGSRLLTRVTNLEGWINREWFFGEFGFRNFLFLFVFFNWVCVYTPLVFPLPVPFTHPLILLPNFVVCDSLIDYVIIFLSFFFYYFISANLHYIFSYRCVFFYNCVCVLCTDELKHSLAARVFLPLGFSHPDTDAYCPYILINYFFINRTYFFFISIIDTQYRHIDIIMWPSAEIYLLYFYFKFIL